MAGTPSKHEYSQSSQVSLRLRSPFCLRSNGYVPARRSACVSARRREAFELKNVTDFCPEPPFILREPQDKQRVEGDDAGIVAITITGRLYFLNK